ncbi:MAG: SDR family oxidoreductase [Acidobacteriota bacterium]|jgi:short-subunit dehydrogenase
MSGKVTLVTGASSGIGRELAKIAAADGGTVVLVARRRERLEELAGEIGDRAEVVVHAADLSEEGARQELVQEMERRGLAIAHLVNNAGFGIGGPFHANDADAERGMVTLDVAALHDLCVRFLPGMVGRGYGRVLNVASTAGYQPIPYMATYGAAKAFVLSFSEALWYETRGTGVAVTCLAPGKTETEFFEDAGMEDIAFAKAPAASARGVAELGYRAMLAGKRTAIPGFQNRLTALLVPRLPKRLVLTVSAALFRPRGDRASDSDGSG